MLIEFIWMKIYKKKLPFCLYYVVHTVLSVYHFVRIILSATILSGHQF